MALFPQGLTNVDQRCNTGERRVLHQLKRCLEDDTIIWHNVPIGPRARQPDFVILSPRQGVLLLEVKDWKKATLRQATRDAVELNTPRGVVTEAHPLRQARDYAMELVNFMQNDPLLVHGDGPFRGKLLFPYGWGVVLSDLAATDVAGTGDFAELFPPERTLLKDDLAETLDSGAFQRRLWGMFTLSFPHTLTLPQRDRIRWHLFPELRLFPPQQALDLGEGGDGSHAPVALPALPDLLQVMDLQQEQIARTLGEGHRVIHGAAGSGKTMILIYRAQVLAAAARPDQPVLVLCFNRTLADRIDAQLRERGVDERVQVSTFHRWCQDVVRSYSLDVPVDRRDQTYYATLVDVVNRSLQTGRVPSGQYTALLVDEAHDFEEAWLRMAVKLVNPVSNSLLVLYDDVQSIYQKQRQKFSLASVGVKAVGRTSVLKLNYRNTAEVLALAVQCAQSLLAPGAAAPDAVAPGAEPGADAAIPVVLPASAGRRGPLPVLLQAGSEREEAELIAERVALALSAGRSASDMAVLCRYRNQMPGIAAALNQHRIPWQSMHSEAYRHFDWQRPSVKLITLHSAKGLEFPLVFIAGLQALQRQDDTPDDTARLLYVGMTRATHELVLSAHGRSALTERVQASLQAVAQSFSSVAA